MKGEGETFYCDRQEPRALAPLYHLPILTDFKIYKVLFVRYKFLPPKIHLLEIKIRILDCNVLPNAN